MRVVTDRDEVIELDEFVDSCNRGNLIDYDGWGYYSDGNLMTSIKVYPSDITNGFVKREWTHVVWFNK